MSDEVMQDLDRMVRVGLTTAAQVGEHLRRRAAEADRRQRDAAVEEQRAAAERVRAIRDEARSHYVKIGWADWQDQATLGSWAEAYLVAHQMRPHDPVAAAAHDRIEAEVRRRYNVDIREALQLHLQQVAEDQRIRAERERDAAAGPEPGPEAATAGPERASADPESTAAAPGPAPHSEPEPGPDPGPSPDPAGPLVDVDEVADLSPYDPNTIPGEVVTEAEMNEARAAAQTAARGFDQTGRAAVRRHRTAFLDRLRGRQPRPDMHRISSARRRGR